MAFNSNINKNNYYPFLDGYRALAILWVIAHHINYFFLMPNHVFSDSSIITKIAYLGFVGVDMFFVISGFLITGILIEDFNKNINVCRFYLRRAFKIVPQYLLVVIVGIYLSATVFPQANIKITSIVGYCTFLQNYLPIIYILGHLWSIAVEEHFYFLYPLLIWVVFRFAHSENDKRRILIFVFIALIILVNIIRYFYFKTLHSTGNPIVWQYTHIRVDALIGGCLLKLLEGFFTQKSPQNKNISGIHYLIAAVCIYIALIFKFNKIGWHHYTLAYVAPSFLIIASLKQLKSLNILLENPALIWIGKKSYGIYLWHYPVLFTFIKLRPAMNPPSAILLYLILAVSLGALSTNTLEKAFLNIRQKIIP